MTMKRIIVLALAVMIAFDGLLFANITADAKNGIADDVDMCISVLSEINVIGNDEVDTLYDNTPVTRAAFAVFAAKAAKIPRVEGKTYFEDVPTDYWANEYINALVEARVIDKAEDNKFNPSDSITYEQAVKIMVVLTGYKEYAMTEADIMTGYVYAANKTGIATTVQNSSQITLKEALTVIFKAMQIDMAIPLKNGSNIKYSVVEGENLLKLHNLYIAEGTVKAVYGYETRGAAKADKGEINISDEIYSIGKVKNEEKALGKTVKYVYLKNEKDKNELIYIDNRKENLVVFSNKITAYDSGSKEISYYNNDETKLYRKTLHQENIILNGKLCNRSVDSEINAFVNGEKIGSIEFIDDNKTVIIRCYDIVVASGYDENTKIIKDYFNVNRSIDLSEADEIIIKNADRTEGQMPTGFPKVLGIAFSDDKDRAEAVVCDNIISTTIDMVSEGGKKIKCGDNTYEINQNVLNSFNNMLKPKTEVKLYLDMCGDVAYIEFGAENDMKIGYLINATVRDDVFDKKCVFKIYYDKKIGKLNLSDRVVLDGEKTDTANIYKLVQGFPNMTYDGSKLKVSPQIIRFNLNSDGLINEIDTVNIGSSEDKRYTLTQNTIEGSKPYFVTFKRLGMDIPYNSAQTTVFAVPMVDENGQYKINGISTDPLESDYKTGYSFVNARNYTVESYNFNRDNQYTDIIVCKREPSVENRNIYMFDEVYESLNEDDEAVSTAKLWTKEGEVNFEIKESAKSDINALNQGDLISISEFSGGGIFSITKLFDVKSKTFTSGNKYWYDGTFDLSNIWQYSKRYQLSKTYVYDTITDTVESCYEFSDLTDANVRQRDVLTSIPIYLYDSTIKKGDKIRAISVNEIKGYTEYGSDADLMLVSSTGEQLRNVYIIR